MSKRELEWAINQMPKTEKNYMEIMDPEEVEKAKKFHESFPQYEITPLTELKEMAKYLGVERICVKDESYRFGLNAFKVLGGSYAIARYIEKIKGEEISGLTFERLTSDAFLKDLAPITFFSATDGNHGRGVAWAAKQLRQKCVIRMPAGSTEQRRRNIEREGAECTIEPVNYDECVRIAAREAKASGNGVVIQDTAWEGYEEIPAWIMQGYGTMAAEAAGQYGGRPTHIFVQAGVGSLAGAVLGYFYHRYKDAPPVMAVVEAKSAACLYRSALRGDGTITSVGGEMPTIMAGLCCGEPNILSWEILRQSAAAFLAVEDGIARRGMRMLAAPVKYDSPVISGESGAAAFGALAEIMKNPEYRELKQALRLDENSKVLLFSTEGDTDPQRWKNIVWEGMDQ